MKNAFALVSLGTVAGLLGGAGMARAGQYVFTDTAFTNCCDQFVTGINDRGQVLGTDDPLTGIFLSFTAKGSKAHVLGRSIAIDTTGNLTNKGLAVGMAQQNNTDAYMINVNTGSLTLLPAVDAYMVGPAHINESGVVVGSAFSANGSVSHGYRYADGKAALFDPPCSIYTTPSVINNAGEIAGTYRTARGAARGFIYSAGRFKTFTVLNATALTITAIDSAGRLAGTYIDSANRTHGILVTGSVVTVLDYPGDYSTIPSAFGPGGSVVGTIVGLNANAKSDGFIYANGAFTLIDDPKANPTYGTSLSAVNAAGTLAGEWFDSNALGHAFTAVFSNGK